LDIKKVIKLDKEEESKKSDVQSVDSSVKQDNQKNVFDRISKKRTNLERDDNKNDGNK